MLRLLEMPKIVATISIIHGYTLTEYRTDKKRRLFVYSHGGIFFGQILD